MQFPDSEFDVDLRERTHRPSGVTFSFYAYKNEEDWQAAGAAVRSGNSDWDGDVRGLAIAAKRAAVAKGMKYR